MTAKNRKVIVLVVDRLSPSQIGAYGNTCHTTDALDEVASQSVLFDLGLSPCLDLPSSYRALFGEPAIDHQAQSGWLQTLTDDGFWTKFVTDRQQLQCGQGFSTADVLSIQALDRLAGRVSQTWLARYFAKALYEIESMPGEGLLWLDCSGFDRQWDAPYSLRQQLADSGDPEPPQFHDVPSFWFDPSTGDPDTLLAVQQALDAQVNMLDQFVGVIWDAIKGPELGTTLFCLTSLQGFPMGQHGRVGGLPPDDASAGFGRGYNESVHVPIMVSLPQNFAEAQAARSGKMVQPNILPEVIDSFLRYDDRGVEDWLSRHLALPEPASAATVLNFKSETGIQTHAWKFLQDTTTGRCELYVKPDDRHEVNDVSVRCHHEVRLFQALMAEILENPNLVDAPEFRLPAELISKH